MKNIFKIAALGAVIVFGATSCEKDANNVIDQVFDGVESGAVLRTITPSADLLKEVPFDSGDAVFEVELEMQDEQGGALLESVDVFVFFTDNTDDAGDSSSVSSDEAFLQNIPASGFSPGPFGLPRTTLTVSMADVFSALGVVIPDGSPSPLFGGDVFTVRVALKLTDGRVFSVDNAGGIITGGFFNSPFQYELRVVCPVENDEFFAGAYLLEETTGATDPFGGAYGPHYPASQNITIVPDGTLRTFEYIIYPDSFIFDQIGSIILNCGKIEFSSTGLGGTLGCTGGANTIEDVNVDPPGDYDLNLIDDAVINIPTLGFGQDDGGCGVGSYQINLRFTKQ